MRTVIIGRGSMVALSRAFAALLLLLLSPLCHRAGAAEYVVGDAVGSGWDSGVNYAAWAREHAFTVGDVLGMSPIVQLFVTFTSELEHTG